MDPGVGQALVRVRRVGVCGTDLHAFKGEQPFFSYRYSYQVWWIILSRPVERISLHFHTVSVINHPSVAA